MLKSSQPDRFCKIWPHSRISVIELKIFQYHLVLILFSSEFPVGCPDQYMPKDRRAQMPRCDNNNKDVYIHINNVFQFNKIKAFWDTVFSFLCWNSTKPLNINSSENIEGISFFSEFNFFSYEPMPCSSIFDYSFLQ